MGTSKPGDIVSELGGKIAMGGGVRISVGEHKGGGGNNDYIGKSVETGKKVWFHTKKEKGGGPRSQRTIDKSHHQLIRQSFSGRGLTTQNLGRRGRFWSKRDNAPYRRKKFAENRATLVGNAPGKKDSSLLQPRL